MITVYSSNDLFYPNNLKYQNSVKINGTTKATDKAKTSKNIIYLKQILEDIFSKLKENIEIKNLLASTKRVEAELSNNNNLLEKILYGKQRT